MSDSKQTGSKSKRIKNRHWKFVKKTFQQSNLAKALLPAGSTHSPLIGDEEEKRAYASSANPFPLHQSYSEGSSLRRGKKLPSTHGLRDVSSTTAIGTVEQFHETLLEQQQEPRSFTKNNRSGSLKRLNSYNIHKDGHHHDSYTNAADESSATSESSRPIIPQTPQASLEEVRQYLLAQAHHRRRLGFLEQTADDEDFICKTLGMDRVHGKCVRHPNQPITTNVQTLLLGNGFCQINICRICQSEIRAGPAALQTSCANLPHMGSVIEQVQKLQSNTKEWDRRTKILGASVMDMNHSTNHSSSHSTYSVANETIHEDCEVEEFGGDDSLSLMDLLRQSSYNNVTGNSPRSQQTDRNNRSSSSSLHYTEDEWAKQLGRRITQVRTWEDRFAIKNHPVFCHYFKMVRMGVPLPAVKYAVETDGYHPSIMDLEENKSLKMQQHLLSQEALENLRSAGALDNVGTGWEQELSNPETVQAVLTAFRQKRVNQIYATMALFSETKLKMRLMQQQQQPEIHLDEQSITSKSIQSMPNPTLENVINDAKVTQRHSTNEVQTLEMDDEISQSDRIRDDLGSLARLREAPEMSAEMQQCIPTLSQKSQKSKETAPTESPHTSLSSRREHPVSPNGRSRPTEVKPATQQALAVPKRPESPSRITEYFHSPTASVPSPSRSKKSWTIRGVADVGLSNQYPRSPVLEIADVLAVADNAIEQDRSKRSAQMASSPRASPGNKSPKARSQSRRLEKRFDSPLGSPQRKLSKEVPKESYQFVSPAPSKSKSRRKTPMSPPIKEVVVSSSDEDAEFINHEQIEYELQTLIRRESKKKLRPDEQKWSSSEAAAFETSMEPRTGIPNLSRAFSRSSSTSHQAVFIPAEAYFKLKEELDVARSTIVLKEQELQNSVKMDEYNRVLSQLEETKSDIAAKQKVIDNSVRMIDFANLSKELESARATIACKSTELQESVSKQEYMHLLRDLQSLKERLNAQKKAEDSASREEHKTLSHEIDQRDAIIFDLEQEIQGLKKKLGSLQIMVVEKEEAIQNYKNEGERKDRLIEQLRQQVHILEKHKISPVLDNAAMQAKIDDAKKRQAALREKFVSLHRVKKTASSPQTDRDFEALALSPAGRKRKGDVSRRRKPKDGSIRPSTRTSTNALTRAPPVYSKSEAALEQSVAHGEITPEQVPDSAIEQATLDRTCSTPVHGGKPVSASPLTTMEGSEASELPTPAKSTSTADSRFLTLDDVLQSPSTKDDTATKEMIMSLFNSWTSKQFTS